MPLPGGAAARVGAWALVDRVGEGASAVVYRARHVDTGVWGALKAARAGFSLRHEAAVASRCVRRWGPALLDVGPDFVVFEWTEGTSLAALPPRDPTDANLALIVAHGVGRALAELHEAGLRHGDVKPANVVLSPQPPRRDTASERGATLLDLGLASDVDERAARGGTLAYLAPEVRARGEAGPAADLYALGCVLRELVPVVGPGASAEVSVWADALLAHAPGGRPPAAWVADRAARRLGLAADEAELTEARAARVRRAYVAVRAPELAPHATLAPELGGAPREWLEAALAPVHALADDASGAPSPREVPPGPTLRPLGALARARWVVALVGPAAAAWPQDALAGDDAALAARLLALARERPPSSWSLDDVRAARGPRAGGPSPAGSTREEGTLIERVAALSREVSRPAPSASSLEAAEDLCASGDAPSPLVIALAEALKRGGEIGRAWVVLARASGREADALRAEIARRRGDRAEAARAAARADARATLARLAWDSGDLAEAERHLEGGARSAAEAEVLALVAYARGAHDAGLRAADEALGAHPDAEASARLLAVRGLLHHARGDAAAAFAAFAAAAEHATRAGALVEEATYLTGEAAAAVDLGDVGRALAAGTRAALLWERLGRPRDASRAWLARAAALSSVGAVHGADEAAAEAIARAIEAGDRAAQAYARWARAEVRPPGDPVAAEEARAAAEVLGGAGADDELRAAARLLVWAPAALDPARVAACDRAAAGAPPPVRWEWWGARARAGGGAADRAVLAALAALVDVPAPLSARGPALFAASRLATELGDGEAARRFEAARRAAAQQLRAGTPAALADALLDVTWAGGAREASLDVSFAPAQVAQLESIVRALGSRDRLKPLLTQVLDALVLWTGVERGLLLLNAGGRLVPRAARNLARGDLRGEQLALSTGIARRALETGEAVVATDAFTSAEDFHASVHALRLRSVLAVPLVSRGEALGVVYLDDRARRGAFGQRELAWVRVLASQAAMAIADARDHVLLRRAARHAERARARAEGLLREREAELLAAQAELASAQGGDGLRHSYDAIIGRSEPMRQLLRLVDRVTESDVPVLICGESGTGKELVARAIAKNGARKRHPFVGENCASVPEALLESTLFGHVRGAFTGAATTRAGLFDVADRGTLFLDEIGEMSLAMQAKLLRVLADGEVRPVGSERSHRVDVRVIAATHRDLAAMVAAGTFREDLFYRLDVVTLLVPPLRERREDIPLLVGHFLATHGGPRRKVTRTAMDKLQAYPWPGNVRQLENEIRRAVVLAGERIDAADLSPDVARGGPSAARGSGLDLRSRVDALSAELVREALERTKGNQTKAAEALGLSRFGLQKMMKRLKIKPRD